MDIQQPAPLFPSLAAPAPGDGTEDGGIDAAAASASSDFDSFLRLLTAQLRNQDPLQPIDSTEFVAQLASFSTVEQLIGTNERLDAMMAESTADRAATFAGWIGQTVTLTDGRFIADGEAVAFEVPAVEGATGIVGVVRRPDGTILRELTLPASGGPAEWDGEDANGVPVVGEVLRIDLQAVAGEELLGTRPAPVYREVVSVRGTEGGAVIGLVDGGEALPGEVAGLGRLPVEED